MHFSAVLWPTTPASVALGTQQKDKVSARTALQGAHEAAGIQSQWPERV